MAVVGEPGVGQVAPGLGVHPLAPRPTAGSCSKAGSVSYGKATAYLPVIDLLKGYFQIERPRRPARRSGRRSPGKLLTLDRALEPACPRSSRCSTCRWTTRPWQALDPPQRRQRTLDAVKRLLLRESQVQPLLVVFEDLHWIDAETQALLDSLVESLPAARLLLLVNYRPEYQHGWGGKTYYRQLRLDPLPPESADELLDALLGDDAGLGAAQAAPDRRGPRATLLPRGERADPGRDRGAGRRARRLPARPRPVDAIQVPATVQAVLAARIDRLPPEDKRLLQAAAVIGKDVPFAAAPGHRRACRRTSCAAGSARLQAAEFLYETRLFPDLEYTFKHALTHEVAYGSLLQERRRALHARIVEAIERLYPERLAEHVERLAHHALRGEVWEQGGRATSARPAPRRSARSAYREAVDLLRAGARPRSSICRRVARRTEQAIDLHLDASSALSPTGRARAKCTDHVREAEALAEALGDERRLGGPCLHLTSIAWSSGDSDRALELDSAALRHRRSLTTTSSLQQRLDHLLGMVWQTRGDYRRLPSASAGSRKRFRAIGERTVAGRRHCGDPSHADRLAWCLAELGEFAEAMARGEEAVRIAREHRSPRSLVVAYRSLGLVSLRRGDLAQAIPPLERAVELCRVDPGAGRSSTSPLRTSATRTRCRAASRRASPSWRRRWPTPRRRAPATIRCSSPTSGRRTSWPAAGTTRPRSPGALSTSRDRQKERGNEAWVLRLLGEIAAQADPPDLEAAEEHYRQALALADELGMRPLVAHCHLGLGKLYRRTGDRAKAQEHLTTAATMYREMGMSFWLEKAEAELGGVER